MRSPNKQPKVLDNEGHTAKVFRKHAEALAFAAVELYNGHIVETGVRYSLRGDGRIYIVRVY